MPTQSFAGPAPLIHGPDRADRSLKTKMLKKELAATANCSLSVSARGADSVQPVEIEIHCDASVFDNHLLKRPAVLLALDNSSSSRRKPLGRSPGVRQRAGTTGAQDR